MPENTTELELEIKENQFTVFSRKLCAEIAVFYPIVRLAAARERGA